MTLNPLANPKGVKILCELCQKPAFIQCTKCRVTYYCCVEHQKADWLGIHEKICQLLIPLRTAMPFVSSEEERKHRSDQLLLRQKQMVDITRTTGQKLLFEGRHEQAIPAAMQSLRFTIQVHGLNSIELVPAYLILGEASIGLGRLTQAEEYLSQAQWTVLKTPDCPDTIKHKLYRNLGLLYASKGELAQALRSLADDVYHASYEYGTEAIETSGAYFHMGNIFYRKGQLDVSDSLYEKVVEIWHRHLGSLHEERLATVQENTLGLSQQEEAALDEAQAAEAVQVLNYIQELRDGDATCSAHVRAQVAHSLGLLYFLLHNIDKAKEFGRKAVVASEGISDEAFTQNIVNFMKICENVM